MLRLNLGCSDRAVEGCIGVDRWTPPWATPENFLSADLRHSWPWADNSIDEIYAHDIFEHLPDIIHTMNELYRVLTPNGMADVIVPTTDGRGAWQDPTHVSYWNQNTLFYFTAGDPHYTRFHEAYGVKGAFKVIRVESQTLNDSVTKMRVILTPDKTYDSTVVSTVVVASMGLQEALETVVVPVEKNNLVEMPTPSTAPAKPQPIFSILHATAHRLPTGWIDAWRAWSKNATHPQNVEYVLCVHESDIEKVKEGVNAIPQSETGIHIVVTAQNQRYCAVDNWNNAAKASHGQILIMGADDLFPYQNWDGALLNAMRVGGKQIGDPFAMFVDAGSKDLSTHPVMSRALYEKWGYFLYPEYEGVYCDNDFMGHAFKEGVMVDARNVPFDHRHPAIIQPESWLEVVKNDPAYAAQNSDARYAQGVAIYNRRKATGFSDSVQPLIDPNKKNLVLCVPGESFSSRWMMAWSNLMLNLSQHFNLFPYNSYSSNVYTTRSALAKAALEHLPHADYVLWIDDDNLLSVEHFQQLFSDLESHPELDMISGWCWIQSDEPNAPVRSSCGVYHPDGSCQSLSADALLCKDDTIPYLLEIEWTGFPVVLMRRSCLVKAGDVPFSPVPTIHSKFGFAGEDVSFCRVAKSRGNCRFAVDRRVKVPHLKLRHAEPYSLAVQKIEEFTHV